MHKAWMDKVEKDSGGRIKFEAYPAMQLGGTPVQLYDQAATAWSTSSGPAGQHRGRFPRIEVFELPFIMNNAEATSKAYWEYVQTMAPDEFKDTQVLALHVHGPACSTQGQADQDRRRPEGPEGAGPDAQITKMLGYLGATPVGMPLPQIPDALSKGTIDGCVIPWEVCPRSRCTS
jgi:TRAP-type C4-dicarboxylate transport system substrate-binding protein